MGGTSRPAGRRCEQTTATQKARAVTEAHRGMRKLLKGAPNLATGFRVEFALWANKGVPGKVPPQGDLIRNS